MPFYSKDPGTDTVVVLQTAQENISPACHISKRPSSSFQKKNALKDQIYSNIQSVSFHHFLP